MRFGNAIRTTSVDSLSSETALARASCCGSTG
jgi:hypothetical protein